MSDHKRHFVVPVGAVYRTVVLAQHYDTLLEALTLAASKPLAQHCTDEEWEFIRSAIMGAQGEQA